MRRVLGVGDISFGTAAAFLLGVYWVNMSWPLWLLAFFGASVVVGGLFLNIEHGATAAAIFLAATASGVIYYHLYIHWQTIHTKLPSGKHAEFFAIVSAQPVPAGNFTMIAAALVRPYAGNIDVFTFAGDVRFHYGDEVWIDGAISPASDPDELPAVFLPQVKTVAEHEGFWLEEKAIDIKEAVAADVAMLFSPDQASVLSAIMIGSAGGVSQTLRSQMDASGTSYIVGMYGYKIAIIVFAMGAAFKGRLSRRMLLWTTLGAVAAFVFISGAGISAVRAGIMGAFAVIARGTGRNFAPRNAVTFAALAMTLADANLPADGAFQLSFLSFLGIYYLRGPIDLLLRKTDPGFLQWKEHVMLSLSTNLAILPVTMNTFGDFSLTSFVSNIFIMLPWAVILAFGWLIEAVRMLMPAAAFPLISVVGFLLQYELLIIRFFTAITVPPPAVFGSGYAVALYYGILIIMAHRYAAPAETDR